MSYKNNLLKLSLRKGFSSKCIVNQIFKSQIAQQVKLMNSIDNLRDEKEFIFNVLESKPSQREAISYLNKMDKNIVNIKEKKFPIILVHLSLPMNFEDLEQVMKTLVYIQKLGMQPMIVLDNLEWQINNRKQKINDGLSLIQMMNKYNIKSRLISNGLMEGSDNMRLKIDINPIISCFNQNNNNIPIILPLYMNSNCQQLVTKSDYTLMALSKCFSRYSDEPVMIHNRKADVHKVLIINSRGGIPNEENKIYPFINLQQQLNTLVTNSNIWKGNQAPLWKRDLDLAYSSLAYLPATTSAVVASSVNIKRVINNIITDKPYSSPSLKDSIDDKEGYTVLRYGLKVKNYSNLDQVDKKKLIQLLQNSFHKELDVDNYFKRLNNQLNHILIAGDYQGVAILTNEGESTCYLDKFAVDPKDQGIGVADVLWQKLKEYCPNLMWRSHINNKVNKWYFERSDGNMILKGTQWRLFWYGNDGIDKLDDYIMSAGKIKASFFPPKK
ncbi:DUF619-domain-containing protein [Neoconidiobolus thromboides FSU 785]|nr:DUF619-domain-containing protein [Neoconidiobolus thromboides FSU 785]